ncbi:hypothetical protein OXIME_001552 [Oxyplasma meridianum]|uniref:Crp/Fnr family transcriptional regulator n=1 Tax=Oxyplasma meridianum TaxID=3073602 RepID=A0AAX4NIE6_9ARCH
MSLEYDQVLDKIRTNVRFRAFPEEYLKGFKVVGEMEIENGSDIFMYRELEGINVVVDGRKTFFNDPYLAKYYYYSSLIGLSSVMIPNKESVRRVIKVLETDLRNYRDLIDQYLSVLDDKARKNAVNELIKSDPNFRMVIYGES